MANTLTNLIPDIYAALDVVSRELVGFIPSVQRDASTDRVAINQTVRIQQTPKNTAGRNITPAMSFPSTADQTVAPASLTITKQRAFPFNWTGEEQKAVDFGPGYLTIQQDQIAQAIRACANEMELDLFNAAYQGASRGIFGTSGGAGVAPFNTPGDLTDASLLRKILDDNGAPMSDRWLVLNTTAGANLRGKQSILTKVNESGTDSTLRQGVLLDVFNFGFRESAQVNPVTAGTGSAYTTNTAGYAIGATSITLITGSGTILAGDIVTFAGDPNRYVVKTGIAAPGAIVLAAPGLVQAIPTSATAVTVLATHTSNVGFSRNALVLASRLPAIPEPGDLAIDRTTVTDPRSGISLEVAAYPGYRMIVYEIAACWGVLALKPEHMAILIG
jgi:P22 coat protein - gene protein 5